MIYLIVGNTGSGKTTYSKELKIKTNGVVFSIDTWNHTLFLEDKKPTDGLEWFLERIDRSEKLIMDLVLQLNEANVDVILDLGFAKFQHREKFRTFAAIHNIALSMHFLDISKDIRLKRVLQRNEEKGETFEFEVSKENFDFMENWFEKPTNKELIDSVLIQN